MKHKNGYDDAEVQYCPRCKQGYKWDWDQDHYVVAESGQPVVTVTIANFCLQFGMSEEIEVQPTICHCGKLLAFTVTDEDGCCVHNNPEFGLPECC